MLRLVNNNERKFNMEIAGICGLREAVIVDFISEMEVGHTKKKTVDGRLWVKCTQKTMTDNIPFLTEETVRNSVRKLEAKGILNVGILDDDKFDRTYWYSLTDYGSDPYRSGKDRHTQQTEGAGL